MGLTEKQISENLGISLSSFNNYKITHPELKEAIKEGRISAAANVTNSLYKLASGYDYEEIREYHNKHGVRIVEKNIKHVPANVAAGIFLVTNWAPDYFKNRQNIETQHTFNFNYDSNKKRDEIDERFCERLLEIGDSKLFNKN